MSECKHLLAAWIGRGPAVFGGAPGRYAQSDNDDLYYCKCCGAVQFGIDGEWSVPGSKSPSRDDEIDRLKRDVSDMRDALNGMRLTLTKWWQA